MSRMRWRIASFCSTVIVTVGSSTTDALEDRLLLFDGDCHRGLLDHVVLCNAGARGATSGDVAPQATTLTEPQRQVDGLGKRGQDAVLRFFSDRGAAREEGRRHLLDLRRLSQAQVRELIG